MSVLINIMAVVGLLACFCVFWWAMIESQRVIPGYNEPGRALTDYEREERILNDITLLAEMKLERDLMDQVNSSNGKEIE